MDSGQKLKLYIVATPLGNLEDITLRALSILKAAPLIACEDTRVSQKLLDHYAIKTKTVSYHQHSAPAKVSFLLERLATLGELAVITDAGTPGISDPGNLLVAASVDRFGSRLEVVAIPGPSAISAALSVSGLPADKFIFLGFLPHKKGRTTVFERISKSKETSVFYESTHRILKTLEQLAENIAAPRRLVVCRELTKKFETVYRGTAREVLTAVKKDVSKGEFVVVVEGKK